jgi:hypothetical protein
MIMTHFDSRPEQIPVIDVSRSPYDTYTVFTLPSSHAEAATSITKILEKSGYMVRLLTGRDNPNNADYLFGALPHPDAATLELLSRETELPVRTPEQRAQAIGDVALA